MKQPGRSPGRSAVGQHRAATSRPVSSKHVPGYLRTEGSRAIDADLGEDHSKTMKLLLTADLHFRIHWFRWLIEQAPSYDLVCIAGDFLDMFKFESRMEQAREIRKRYFSHTLGHVRGRLRPTLEYVSAVASI